MTMNRRQALRAIVGGVAGLIPSWQLLQQKRRDIDLQPFCAKKASRYDMTKPFVQSGKLFATDGKICLRLPTHLDDVLSDEIRLPPADRLEWWQSYGAWPKVEGPARIFEGANWCIACNGYGYADGKECVDCDGEDFHCHCKTCGGSGISGKVECRVCKGKPFGIWPNFVQVTAGGESAFFERMLFERVQRIGDVRMRLMPSDVVAALQFDGGDGMLMALDPSVARRLKDTGDHL